MNVSDHIWKNYRQELQRFVAARVNDKDTSEDLVHEVLVRAYAHRDQLTQPEKLRGWLYSITRNVIVDHYRAQRPTDPIPDDLAEDTEASATTAGRQLASCLAPLIDQLPHDYREALVLSDLRRVPQADIARQFGLSLSGAKSRVQRARQMLKDIVLECCRIEFDHQGRLMDYEQRGDCGVSCDLPPAPSE